MQGGKKELFLVCVCVFLFCLLETDVNQRLFRERERQRQRDREREVSYFNSASFNPKKKIGRIHSDVSNRTKMCIRKGGGAVGY